MTLIGIFYALWVVFSICFFYQVPMVAIVAEAPGCYVLPYLQLFTHPVSMTFLFKKLIS